MRTASSRGHSASRGWPRPVRHGAVPGWPVRPWVGRGRPQWAVVITLQLLAIVLLPHLAAMLLRAPLCHARGLPLRYASAATARSHG